jgi:hypothetical protein
MLFELLLAGGIIAALFATWTIYRTSTLDLTRKYPYPKCYSGMSELSCVSNGNTILGLKYLTEDERCFESTGIYPIEVLDKAILTGENVDKYFKSCDLKYDTRSVVIGRFIRLQKNDNKKLSINIFEVYILDDQNNIVFYPPYDIHVNNFDESQNYYSLMSKDNKTIVSTGISDTPSYIQLDLGSNKIIKKIEVDTDEQHNEFLIGSTLYIIKDTEVPEGPVIFKYDINSLL